MEGQDPFDYLYDCKICHAAPVDKTENPHSVLCRNCREKAIHYPIPRLFLPIAAIICIITVLSYANMAEDLTDYRIYATAQKQIAQGNLYDTLTNLEEVASRHPNSVDAAVRLVTLSMDYGCYDYAAYAMDTYLVGKTLSDTVYGDMIHYQNILESYYDTQDRLNAFFSELEEDMDEETFYAALRDKLDDMKEDPQMYKPLVYYYASGFARDPEEAKENLLMAVDSDFMNFSAMADLGTRFRREGDLNTARSYYESILQYEQKEPSANRGMAILEMLNGNMEQGLAYAQTAYENGPDASYVRETYLIALSMNGLTEESARLKEEMADLGEPVEAETEALLKGETTLEEYYIGEE